MSAGTDWARVLHADAEEAADAYDETVADVMHQDHPRQVPVAATRRPVDEGEDEPELPIDEA